MNGEGIARAAPKVHVDRVTCVTTPKWGFSLTRFLGGEQAPITESTDGHVNWMRVHAYRPPR